MRTTPLTRQLLYLGSEDGCKLSGSRTKRQDEQGAEYKAGQSVAETGNQGKGM
jgi:hypothetical protein